MKIKKKIILTDADGVLLNWEYAFNVWMDQHGFEELPDSKFNYDMGERYGIPKAQVAKLVRIFNESAAIGFLPAFRDAMYYVKRLHEEHGYEFHCITSLSLDANAYKLRKMNLDKLFGEDTFTKLICLDTGAAKDEALSKYKDSEMWWLEDKPENAEAGIAQGLKPVLFEHGHNMHYRNDLIPIVDSWKQFYKLVTKG